MNILEMFNNLRKQGWRGTFMLTRSWIIIIGSYRYNGPTANDNEAKP